MNPVDLVPPLERAFRATRRRVLEAYARPSGDERLKGDRSVVTDLDLALEAELVDVLLALEPSFGVVSEERGTLRPGSPAWHLDPLDGSFNFSRRVPLFASQVALLDGATPILGAIYEPLRDDFTWAARGAGTWREGRRVRVGGRPARSAMVLVDVDERGVFQEDPALVARLRRSVYRLRSFGSIGLHLREVAVGVADAVVGGRGRPQPLHDLAPGAVLVREAGGLVTDAAGVDVLASPKSLVAGGPEVHAALLALLREPGKPAAV